MSDTCTQCQARGFAAGELHNGDAMIRNVDQIMAEAIRAVADL
jgi:hypothetical protein